MLNEQTETQNSADASKSRQQPIVMPESCEQCAHFSGDGFNECCKHPSYIDDGFNMNARPARCRMHGCPLEA